MKVILLHTNHRNEWPKHVADNCNKITFINPSASVGPRNTVRTGDADLRFYITTVQDG